MAIDDATRIKHMLDTAEKIVSKCRGKKRVDLDADEDLVLILVRLLEVFGEAANGITQELQAKSEDIAWRESAAMRNRLIHAYFDVNLDIVWKVVSEEIPAVIEPLKKISKALEK